MAAPISRSCDISARAVCCGSAMNARLTADRSMRRRISSHITPGSKGTLMPKMPARRPSLHDDLEIAASRRLRHLRHHFALASLAADRNRLLAEESVGVERHAAGIGLRRAGSPAIAMPAMLALLDGIGQDAVDDLAAIGEKAARLRDVAGGPDVGDAGAHAVVDQDAAVGLRRREPSRKSVTGATPVATSSRSASSSVPSARRQRGSPRPARGAS